MTIQWVEKKLNEFLNNEFNTSNRDYVLLSDTDSLTVDLSLLVDSKYKDCDTTTILNALDDYSKNIIQAKLAEYFEDLADNMNAYQNQMFMKRENICDKVVCMAKKIYIMNVWDSEGGVRYSSPKLKIMGYGGKKSNIPAICRIALRDCVDIIMNKSEDLLQEYIDNFKELFYNSKFIDIAQTTSCKGVNEYVDSRTVYKKGTPIAVRGAILHNTLLKDLKLENRIEKITPNDKVKCCYLVLPNILNENIIASVKELPIEFELDEFIDYHLQYEKTFTNQLNKITDIIGWSHKKEINLLAL